MKAGFTGTREGLTAPQGGALARFVRDTTIVEFHHGCCLGADLEAVSHVRYYQPGAVIHSHPSTLKGMTSDLAASGSSVHNAPKPPLARNRDIVDASDVLLACPKGPEETRSGTWSTVRYARKQGKRLVVFWPDGRVTEE